MEWNGLPSYSRITSIANSSTLSRKYNTSIPLSRKISICGKLSMLARSLPVAQQIFFWLSGIFSTYSFKVMSLSSLEVVNKSKSFNLFTTSLPPLQTLPQIPIFKDLPYSFQNCSYLLRSFLSVFANCFKIVFSKFLPINFNSRLCCKSSREIFKEKSGESTKPLTKRRYSGKRSLHLSMMNTWRE